MMKRIIPVSLLMGVLALGSCIKETESPSVTNVRNSVAALNNATAQSALILANSQAALDAAQADLLAAQSKLVVAQAEEQTLRNQLLEVQISSARAELEAQLAEVEVRKAQAAADVKRITAQVEIDLVNAKTQLVQAQQAYQTAATAFDTYKANEILQLANSYTVASNTLLDAQMQLITLESQKAGLENDLASLNSTKEEIIRNNNAEIESIRKIIAALEKTMDMTPEQLTVKLNEKMAEVVTSNDAYTRAKKAQADAQTAIADQKLEISTVFQYYLNPSALIKRTSFTSMQEAVSESGRVIVDGFGTQITLSPLDQTTSKNIVTYGYEFGPYNYAIAIIARPSLKEGMIDIDGYARENAEFRRETFQRAADSLKSTAKFNYDELMTMTLKDKVSIEAETAQYERYVAKVDELLGDKPGKLVIAQQKAAEAKANAKTCKKALKEYVSLTTAADKVDFAEATNVLNEKQTAVDNLNTQIATAKTAMGTFEGYQIVVKLYTDMINQYEVRIATLETQVETLRLKMEENEDTVRVHSEKALCAKADYDDAEKAYGEARLLNLKEPSEEHAAAEAAALAVRNDKFTIWKTEAAALEVAEINLQTASSDYLLAQAELNACIDQKTVVENQLGQTKVKYETNKQIVDSLSLLLPDATEELRRAQIAYDAANQRVLDQLKDDPTFIKLNDENIQATAAKEQTAAEVAAIQASIDNVLKAYPEYDVYLSNFIPQNKIVLLDYNAIEKVYKLAYDDILAQVDEWLNLVCETIDEGARYSAAIAGLNELLEAGWRADNECKFTLDEKNAVNLEFEALSTALNNALNVKTQITMYNERIVTIQAANQKVLTDIKDYETMVQYLKSQMDAQKEVIAANEASVKVIKEALDRAIAGGQQQKVEGGQRQRLAEGQQQ